MEENEGRFEELLDSIKVKQKDGLSVRITFHRFFGWQDDLEVIKRYRIEVTKDKVRVQPNCHTKGIIIDSKTVVMGSNKWINSGALHNRDARLSFCDEKIAKHFETGFLYDWENLTGRNEAEEWGDSDRRPQRTNAAGFPANIPHRAAARGLSDATIAGKASNYRRVAMTLPATAAQR